MTRVLVSLALALVPGVPIHEDATGVSARDLSWLAGTWEGTGLGGECEEIWSEPRGGAMLGVFRLFRDGEPELYELMILTRDEQGLALKVKHFSPDFSAWEEGDEAIRFPFEGLDGRRARFGGLEIERRGDRLDVDVTFRDDDGSTRVERFEMRRR